MFLFHKPLLSLGLHDLYAHLCAVAITYLIIFDLPVQIHPRKILPLSVPEELFLWIKSLFCQKTLLSLAHSPLSTDYAQMHLSLLLGMPLHQIEESLFSPLFFLVHLPVEHSVHHHTQELYLTTSASRYFRIHEQNTSWMFYLYL